MIGQDEYYYDPHRNHYDWRHIGLSSFTCINETGSV